MRSFSLSTHLSDYLKPIQIIYELKSKDKVQALDELLDVLAKQKLIENKKLLLTRIIDRERLESTAIGHNVALPHARVDTGGDIAIAVGKSKSGIDFDAIDDKKVHIIILVGLAQFLRKDGFRRRLFEAKNKTELFQVLSEVELRLPREDRIISRGSLLEKLQTIEIKRKKAKGSQLKQLKEQATLIRQELDRSLVDRFDRLMQRYGFAVSEVNEGVCQGCNINVATGMSSAIEGSNDIYVCENCGKFLVASKKKKK